MADDTTQQSKGLNSRLSRLERNISQNHKSLLSKIRDEQDKSQEKLNKINDDILSNVKSEYDVNYKNLINITRQLMYYINKYTVDIAFLVGMPITGQYKFAYVVSVLADLFVDLSVDLLGTIIENTYQTEFKINRRGLELEHENVLHKEIKKKKGRFFFNARRRISSSLNLRIGNP